MSGLLALRTRWFVRRVADWPGWPHQRWFLQGDGFECPCCGATFRRALTYRGRRDARCPSCLALERHRVLWLFLASGDLLDRERVSVLHFAPERAIERKLRAYPNVLYTSADLEPGLADTQADITAMPFRDGSFDVVICSHVLEHVREDRLALREIHRVLAPEGLCLLQQPVDRHRAETDEDAGNESKGARLAAFLQEDHVRIYGRDFTQRVEEAGFDVVVFRPEAHFTQEAIRRHALGVSGADEIYVGSKPPRSRATQ
jgi:SAM-dependent methyltransferase